jgi:hypothetical protein
MYPGRESPWLRSSCFATFFQVLSHDGDSRAEFYHPDNPGSPILIGIRKQELEAGIRHRPGPECSAQDDRGSEHRRPAGRDRDRQETIRPDRERPRQSSAITPARNICKLKPFLATDRHGFELMALPGHGEFNHRATPLAGSLCRPTHSHRLAAPLCATCTTFPYPPS